MLDVSVDNLREAAELLLDGLRLLDKYLKHSVLGTLGQDEVVTLDLGGSLELAVDTAVALLDAARIPRQVEVEEVRTVSLEVQALTGSVGRKQDAQWLLGRVGVDSVLGLLALSRACEAVDHLDALVGAVGSLDGLLKDGLQVALCALAVLSEDQNTAVVPPRGAIFRSLAEERQARTEVLANPVNQPASLGIGQVPRPLCNLVHAIKQHLLPPPECFSDHISGRVGFRYRGDGFNLGCLVGLEFLGVPFTALIVGIGGGREQLAVARLHTVGSRCPPLLPLSFHGCAVHLEAPCERLNRREEALVETNNEQPRSRLRTARGACETLFAHGAVLVEQTGQRELRSVLG